MRAVTLALLVASCRAPVFECEANATCDLGDAGFCDAATRRCAYADDACPSGARLSQLAGDQALTCLPTLPYDHPAVLAQRIAAPPVIDGDPSELQLGPPLVLASTFGVRARIWFRHDDAGLYVGAVVDDPRLEATKVLEDELWLEDGLEFMIDTAHDRENGVLPRSDDYKFIVTALNAQGSAWGGVRPHHSWDGAFDSAVIADGTLNQASDADRGYTAEMFVPWSIGVAAPRVGQSWGLNVKVNDLYAGQARNAIWRTGGGFNNPAHAGTLVFADGAPPQVVEASATAIDPKPPFIAVDLREHIVGDSTNFAPDQPLMNLFDGCLDTAPGCAAGAEADRFAVAFDLGDVRELHSVRLFGDTRHDWTSRSLRVRHRERADAAWIEHAVPAFRDAWIVADLGGVRAREVEVEVVGAHPGVEARELQLYARPADMR